MTLRVFVIGTDTSVGKTTVCCALLRAAVDRGLRAVPFKPAQSGPLGPNSDTEQLLRAAGLSADTDAVALACPHRFTRPLAPGIAEDLAPFLRPGADSDCREPPALHTAREALATWEQQHRAQLSLIEGAGGLHVPMPGGSWLPQWVSALSTHTIVVGREGLGTIHHTLATIAGLRAIHRPPVGFILSQTGAPDESSRDNAPVIAARSGIPHLGTLARSPRPPAPAAAELLEQCLAHLPPLKAR